MKQIITATVAVIMICLVAVPLIDDSTNNVVSIANNTTEKYIVAAQTSASITIEYTETPGTFLIDGVSKTFTSSEYSDFWCVLTNNCFVRLHSTGSWIVFEGLTSTSTSLSHVGDKVTINPSGWEIIVGSNTYSGTYDWICYPSENGTYGMLRFNAGSVHIDNDATVYAIKEARIVTEGLTTAAGVIWSGSINGGTETKFAWDPTANTDVTSSTDVYIKYAEIGDHSTKITGVYEKYNNNNEYSIPTVIAPIQYHTITENDGMIITLLEIIPVLFIAALLVGIGYSIMRRE